MRDVIYVKKKEEEEQIVDHRSLDGFKSLRLWIRVWIHVCIRVCVCVCLQPVRKDIEQ